MTKKTTPKLIIFDMDGVVFDTEHLSYECMVSAIESMGYAAFPKKIYEQTIGISVSDGFDRKILIEYYGQDFDFEKAEQLQEAHKYLYIKEHGIPLKQGILTFT